MAKTASHAAVPSNRPASPGGLASRLLRSLQRSAGGRDAIAETSALAQAAETATALQLLRVSVETMAEIRADADRACDRAIHAQDPEERDMLTKRVEERVRDLAAAGAKTVFGGHPSLVKGAWMVKIPLPDGETLTARIPGLRASAHLQTILTDRSLTGRDRLDILQTTLSDLRIEIRDTRIAILGVLDNLSDGLEEAA